MKHCYAHLGRLWRRGYSTCNMILQPCDLQELTTHSSTLVFWGNYRNKLASFPARSAGFFGLACTQSKRGILSDVQPDASQDFRGFLCRRLSRSMMYLSCAGATAAASLACRARKLFGMPAFKHQCYWPIVTSPAYSAALMCSFSCSMFGCGLRAVEICIKAMDEFAIIVFWRCTLAQVGC
jgi:hypothetical protein